MKYKYLLLAISLIPNICLSQNVDDSISEAEFLLRQGEIQPAIDMALRLEKEKPKDGNINIFLGDCYRTSGDSKKAIESYRAAQKKGVNEAWLKLASLATFEYRTNDAEEDIELYKKGLKKGRKTLPDESGEVAEQLEKTKNMLTRVQQIVVIDSINVPAEDFFTAYKISPESGTLSDPSILPQGFPSAYPTVVYTTEDKQECLWAAPDSTQTFGIVSSTRLYDGTWDKPVTAGNILNEGGDANYPFLMPDGVTLYYANDGENSLGGYDIFISRREGTEFLQPQNIGMPFNSPYNDYMLAIDELTGVGWWATDRNRIPGHITIYIYIPQEMRINYDPETPELGKLAMLKSFRDTWIQGEDYTEIIAKANDSLKSTSHTAAPEFELSIPGRGTVYYLNQLRNPEARREMKQTLKLVSLLEDNSQKLVNMRKEYSSGKTSLAEPILKLEAERRILQENIIDSRNKVIKLENRNNRL